MIMRGKCAEERILGW